MDLNELKKRLSVAIETPQPSFVNSTNLRTPTTGTINWDSLIDKYSQQYPDVPKHIIKGILEQESQGDANATGKPTKYGTAKGPFQFIDSTAQQYIPGWKSAEDSYDPEKATAGAFNYVSALLKETGGDVKKAVGRYFGTGYDPVAKMDTNDYAGQVIEKSQKYNDSGTPFVAKEQSVRNNTGFDMEGLKGRLGAAIAGGKTLESYQPPVNAVSQQPAMQPITGMQKPVEQQPVIQQEQKKPGVFQDIGNALTAGAGELTSSFYSIPAGLTSVFLGANNLLNKGINAVTGRKLFKDDFQTPEMLTDNKLVQIPKQVAEEARSKVSTKDQDLVELVKKGDVGGAARFLGNWVFEQVPQQVMNIGILLAGVPNVEALTLMGMTTGGSKEVENAEKVRSGEITQEQSALSVLGNEAFEAGTEFFGDVPVADALKKAFAKKAGEVGVEAAKETLGKTFQRVLKGYFGAVKQEVPSEVVATIGQALTDKYSGINPNLTAEELFSQVVTTAAGTSLMGQAGAVTGLQESNTIRAGQKQQEAEQTRLQPIQDKLNADPDFQRAMNAPDLTGTMQPIVDMQGYRDRLKAEQVQGDESIAGKIASEQQQPEVETPEGLKPEPEMNTITQQLGEDAGPQQVDATEEQINIGKALAVNNGKVVFQKSSWGMKATNPNTGEKVDIKPKFEFKDKETNGNITMSLDEISSPDAENILEEKILEQRKAFEEGEKFRKENGLTPSAELDEQDRVSKQKKVSDELKSVKLSDEERRKKISELGKIHAEANGTELSKEYENASLEQAEALKQLETDNTKLTDKQIGLIEDYYGTSISEIRSDIADDVKFKKSPKKKKYDVPRVQPVTEKQEESTVSPDDEIVFKGKKKIWEQTRKEIEEERDRRVKWYKGEKKNVAYGTKWADKAEKSKLSKAAEEEKRYYDKILNESHKERIIEALADGEKVPDEVLKDYPDLKVKQEESTVSPENLPKAKDIVDGLKVRKEIPNTSSIESSLNDYTELDGVREIPISNFELTGKSYSKSETDRIKNLADEIQANGEINPLIVVKDKEGYYILEGGHRAEALFRLGKKTFPAKVVIDNESVADEQTLSHANKLDEVSTALYDNMLKFREKSAKDRGVTVTDAEKTELSESSKRQAQTIIDAVDNKDIGELEARLTVLDNKGSRKGFEIVTGITLPNTAKGTRDTIRKFVGEENYDTFQKQVEESRVKKEEEQKQKEYNTERDKLLDAKITYNGTPTTYRGMIDGRIKDGWKVEVEQRGIRQIYKLSDGDNTVTLPKKMMGEYAQEEYDKKVESEIPESQKMTQEEEDHLFGKEQTLSPVIQRPEEQKAEIEAINTNPTEPQKEAGNYRKAHIKRDGMDISIENAAGQERKGTDKAGKEWKVTMNHDYGYIRGTKGADAYRGRGTDQLDVFINPGSEEGVDVFVVNQKDPATGKFDEHKVMVGFKNKVEAAKAYNSNYEAGWKGLKSIVRMPMDKFKEWAYSDLTKYELKEKMVQQGFNAKDQIGVTKNKLEDTNNIKENTDEKEVSQKTETVLNEKVETPSLENEVLNRIKITDRHRNDVEKYSKAEFAKLYSNEVKSEVAKAFIDSTPETGYDKTFDNAVSYEGTIGIAKNLYDKIKAEKDTDKVETPSSEEPQVKGIKAGDEVTYKGKIGKVVQVDPVKGKIMITGGTDGNLNGTFSDQSVIEGSLKKVKSKNEETPAPKKSVKERAREKLKQKVAEENKSIYQKNEPVEVPKSQQEFAMAKDKAASAVDKMKKLLSSLETRDPNTMYSIGTEQMEIGFEIVSDLVDAGIHTFKGMVNFIKENLPDALKNAEFKKVIEMSYDSYYEVAQEDGNSQFEKREQTTDDLTKEVEDDSKGTGELLETLATEDGKEYERNGAESESNKDAKGKGGNDKKVRRQRSRTTRSTGDSGPVNNNPEARRRRGVDHVIDPKDLANKKARSSESVNETIDAIKLVKVLEKENRLATQEEQKVLQNFGGWGVLSAALNEDLDGIPWNFRRTAEWLRENLTPEEMETARRSRSTSHYTSVDVVKGVWGAVKGFGFTGGNVLEPAIGASGNFIGLRPSGIDMNIDGVEMDIISSKIASQLYQNAEVQGLPYEKFETRKNYYDLVISNVPFYDVIPVDKNYKKYGINNDMYLHNFYFAKSLYAARPGGIVAFVTTHGTLDAKAKRSHIDYITKYGNVLGAVRLPNTAFSDIAGTEVVTDVIFIQKKREGEEDNDNNKLIKELKVIELKKEKRGAKGTSEITKNVVINQYFYEHPEMVVGQHSLEGSMYGPDEYTVDKPENYVEDLTKAFNNLPKNVIDYDTDFRNSIRDRMGGTPKDIPLGSYYETDGVLYQKRLNYETDEFYGEKVRESEITINRIKAIIKLKNEARKLFLKQVTTEEDVKVDIKNLDKQYDEFVKKYGYAHDRDNIRIIENDPDAAMVLGLEKLNKQTQKYEKSDFLKKEIQRKPKDIEKVDNVRDAYILSLSDRGKLDIGYIANKTGRKTEEVVKELLKENMIFENPAIYITHGEDVEPEYVAREQYLSGNVRLKYKQAKKAAESNARFNSNVDELRKIQPMERTQEQIYLNPENPVVPEKYLEDFVKEVILNDTEDSNLSIEHDRIGSKFTVNYTTYNDFNTRGGIVTTDGRKVTQTEIFEYALNNSKPSFTYKSGDDKVVDTVANTKISEMGIAFKEKFRDWIWNNKERAENIIDLYNDMYNNKHNREYIHPLRIADPEATVRFVGCSYIPRKHQADVVWRIIQSQTCMMAHEVGAGKTFACIAAAMELKRLGLRKKNMIVVPNNMTGNWEKEIRAAYPGANILVSSDKNFSELKRKEFINNAAMNDYDIIVMRYSHFLAIAPNETMAATYIGKRIETLKEMLSQIDETDQRAATRREKDIQKQIDRLESRLKKIIDGIKKDEGIPTFDLMGVDQLFVDEADNFKNLNYQSKIQNILGMGDREGSNQAIDMHIKTQYILGKNGGVVFATGTPISNSLVETYHMTSYLQPWYLEDNGLEAFDEWTNAMAEGKTSFEQNASGTGIVKRTRLTKYTNVQTLIAELSEVWDVVDARYLEEQGVLVKGKQLPNVKRTIVEVPASEMLQDYMMHLMYREDLIRERKGPPKKGEDIIPVVMLHGAMAAIDLQIINKKIPKKGYSKLDSVIDNAIERRKKFPDKCGVIFYDKTAPKKGKESVGIDPYQVIKERLIASGTTKPEEIAIIHDYKKDELIEKVFDPFNRGEIKVLLGNTERMGAGVNIQEKLKWLFHVDTRHRPRDILQREGRIVRQGNTNDEVEIVTFVTKGTADAGMWELVNTKAKMIGNILNGRDKDTHVFDEEDQFDNVSVAALLSPSLKDRAEINQQIKAVTDKKTFLISKKRTADKELPFIKKEITRLENAIIPQIQEDYESVPDNKEDIVVDFGDKKIKGVKEAREEVLARFKKFEENAVVGEKAKQFKFGNITVYTEKKIVISSNGEEVRTITEWKNKDSKFSYRQDEYTAEGVYNSIGKIKNALGNELESRKKLLSEKKRLAETYNKDSNINIDELNNQLKALNEKLKEVEKQVEVETEEKIRAYVSRKNAPDYVEYDWASYEAERKPTVSDDEEGDAEPKAEENILSGSILKDGDEYELAEPDNVYRNQSNGFKLIDKPYKVDLEIDGEFFAYKDGKEWVVIEGTTGQTFGAKGKTKVEAINAALNVIERYGENTFRDAMKAGLKKRGLSPRYRIVEKKSMASALAVPTFKITDLAKPVTPAPVKVNPVQTVKAAPSGKKLQYAQASSRLGNQISNEPKEVKDTNFLTPIEKIKTNWFEDVFPLQKIEDVHDKDLGVSRDGAREMDKAVDAVLGSPGATHRYIDENLTPILREGTKNAKSPGEVYVELNKYLVAKRASWLYDNNPNFADIGINKDTANDFVEFIETGAHPHYDRIMKMANGIWQYEKELLKIKRDANVLGDVAIAELDEPYYVPFYRDMETIKDAGKTQAGGQRYYTLSTGIKKGIKGSLTGKKVIDPIQSIQLQTYETIINANRNKCTNVLFKLAEESEEVKKYFTLIPDKWVKAGTIEYRMEADALLRPMLEDMAKNDYGLTVEYKTKLAARVKGRLEKVLGLYKDDTLKTLVGSTEGTFAHELGHAIHEKTSWYRDFIKDNSTELNNVAATRYLNVPGIDKKFIDYVQTEEEKAAEFIAMYVIDREGLNKLAPKAMQEFEIKILSDNTMKKLIGMQPSNVKGIYSKTVDNVVQLHQVPRDADVISGFVDGKITSYRVPVEIADAVKNMDVVAIPEFIRILFTPINKIVRAGAVAYNVDFLASNPARDVQESAFKGRTIPIYDFIRGAYEVATNGEYLKEWERNYGSMNHAEAGNKGYLRNRDELKYGNPVLKYLDHEFWNEYKLLKGSAKAAFDVFKSPLEAIRAMTGALEAATRVGTYRRARRALPKGMQWYSGKPMDIEDAIRVSRDATNDFQRGGKYSKKMNSIIPFSNAAIRGMYTTYRYFRDDPKRALLGYFVYAIVPTLLQFLMTKDEEWYKAIKLKERLDNWIIPNPLRGREDLPKWLTGPYFTIPKGFWMQPVANPLQIALEKANGMLLKSNLTAYSQVIEDVDPYGISTPAIMMMNYMTSSYDNMPALKMLPVSVRMILDPALNYDFYWHKEIEAVWDKASSDRRQRYDKYTSESMKMIGKALNISPKMMQHEFELIGAGAGRNVLWLADYALGKRSDKGIDLDRVPIVRRFYGKIKEYSTDMDEDINLIDKQLRTMNDYKANFGKRKMTSEQLDKIEKSNTKVKQLLYFKRRQLVDAKARALELLKNQE